MKEHNKNFYSLEELKRARDCYEGYQDGEEVYYFVGALRYACDEIERLNNIINKVIEEIEKDRKKSYNDLVKKSFYCNKTDKLLALLKGVDKE